MIAVPWVDVSPGAPEAQEGPGRAQGRKGTRAGESTAQHARATAPAPRRQACASACSPAGTPHPTQGYREE